MTLCADNAWFSWGGGPGAAPVLQGVTCDVTPGTVTAVVGPNGSGKSTLLSLLAGEQPPSQGQILLDSRTLKAIGHVALARRRAVVPQRSLMTAPFRIEDVVAMGRSPWASLGRPARDREIVDESLRLADLGDLRRRPYPSLSGGERQRVHIARAMAQAWPEPDLAPTYLLLDEATSALDLAHAHATFSMARVMASAGVGVLLVVHDLNAALRYADHIVVLQGGVVVASGPPRTTITPEVVATVFGMHAALLQDPDGLPQMIPLRPVAELFPPRSLRCPSI